MSGGRWDPQTRIAVVVVGMLVVTIGALSTVQWRSGLGAAALVIGGILVVLAGVAGGTVFGPRELPEITVVAKPPAALEPGHADDQEALVAIGLMATSGAKTPQPRTTPIPSRPMSALAVDSSGIVTPVPANAPEVSVSKNSVPHGELSRVAQAYQAGDVEGATAAFLAELRSTAPRSVEYYEGVRDIVLSAIEGRSLTQLSGHPLGPVVIDGLPIAVDIRAGAQYSLEAMVVTYQVLTGGPATVDAILVVVNTDDDGQLEPLGQLQNSLECRIVPVAWQLGHPVSRVVEGIAQACHDACQDPQPSDFPPQPQPQPSRHVPQPRNAGKAPSQPVSSPPALQDDDLWQRASDLHWRGQLQEAEEAYRKVVDTRGRSHGWEHPSTLTARDQHATVLRDLDRLAEALVECDEVLRTRTELLGPDHVDSLTSRSHLATIYHQLGDLTRAETEHRQVLEIRSRVLGSRDAETLISRSQLAKVYQDLGELDKAIDEHEIVMRERSDTLGQEHRDTLMSRSLLASALHQAGRLEEAEAQHRAVLAGRLRELGPTHLDTAVSRHRLASVLHDLNLLDEAIDEYRSAREVYAELLGASSPFARAAASDLALAERARRAALD